MECPLLIADEIDPGDMDPDPAGRLDLLGNVKIRDTTLTLDANFVQYFTRDERLEAHNRVVSVNRRSGSVLRGPNLTYLRAVSRTAKQGTRANRTSSSPTASS